jgi:ribosomal protein S25
MCEKQPVQANGINTLNEKPLHAALKTWYAAPDDQLEVRVDGYIIDLVHGDLLVEIQTGSFTALRRKLYQLTEQHSVRLVFPVAMEKWIITPPVEDGGQPVRRKSPRHGRVEQVFRELVHLPALLTHANFSLEVLLIQEEEVRRPEGKKTRWKKGWVKEERRLVAVIERRVFETPTDLASLLPTSLEEPFTARELAKSARMPIRLAQQMLYCLRASGVVEQAGMRGRAYLYTRHKQ